MIPTDWSSRWAIYKPHAIALEEYETGRKLSWLQYNNVAGRMASFLESRYKIQKGDIIALLAENSLELALLFAAAQKLGFVLVPLNYRLTGSELEFLLEDCKPKLLLYDDKFSEKIKTCRAIETIQAQLTTEKLAIENDRAVATNEAFNYQSTAIQEDDPIFLIYTSGTTAFPKASIYTHKMLFWNSINTQMRLDITGNDRSLNCAPSFHTGAWNVLLTPFLHHGAYTLLMRKFDPAAVIESLEKHQMTVWWAVPTMLKMLAEEPALNNAQLDHLRYFIVGGEAMPIPLIKFWHNKGILIRQGYGLTEVGPNVTSLNHEDAIRKQGSIGKPNFYYQVKIVDDQGKEACTGEFLLKGPSVTPGYWNNEKATNESIIDGWFHTGDLVRIDDEGFIYIVDRIKNMYISGGENVYPAEVEFILRQHPAVQDVAIVGVPDQKWGETGMAFIIPEEKKSVDIDILNDYCLQKLAKYKIPRHFVFIDELPKNDAGKTDRKLLKNIAKEKLVY